VIVEQRSYLLRPGKTGEFLSAVETLGLPLLKPILGGLIGYFTSETGALNEVAHLWAYESLEERARRRKILTAHPDWPRFTAAVEPLLERMETRILVPAPFTPLNLAAVRAMNGSEASVTPP